MKALATLLPKLRTVSDFVVTKRHENDKLYGIFNVQTTHVLYSVMSEATSVELIYQYYLLGVIKATSSTPNPPKKNKK